MDQSECYPGTSRPRPRELKFGGRGQYCCVPLCKNARYDKNMTKTGIGLFKFPRNNPELMRKWIRVINNIRRRGGSDSFNTEKKETLICEFHFRPSEIVLKAGSSRKSLVEGAVPSIFNFKNAVRQQIARKSPKKRAFTEVAVDSSPSIEGITDKEAKGEESETFFRKAAEISCSHCEKILEELRTLQEENNTLNRRNLALVEEIETLRQQMIEAEQCRYSHENLSKDPKLFKSSTGLEVKRFEDLFTVLNPGDNCENLKYYKSQNIGTVKQVSYQSSKRGPKPKLLAIEQLFMVLVWLKNGFNLYHMSWLFSLPKSTVSRQLTSWINYIYFVLGSVPIWPCRDQVDLIMPKCFKSTYPSTRCIIDCTELFCQVPSSMKIQSAMYSHYKSHVTYKGLLGIAPSGAITFISQLFDGSISDKEIVQRSGILNPHLWEKGDSVMADRGFTIANDLAPFGVTLNIPAFLSGREQFTTSEVIESQTIASVRIHVERAIQRVKRFRILRNEISLSLHGSINQVWTIVCLLTNFLPPLIETGHQEKCIEEN